MLLFVFVIQFSPLDAAAARGAAAKMGLTSPDSAQWHQNKPGHWHQPPHRAHVEQTHLCDSRGTPASSEGNCEHKEGTRSVCCAACRNRGRIKIKYVDCNVWGQPERSSHCSPRQVFFCW